MAKKRVLNLTNASVKKILPPDKGRDTYYDRDLPGFLLRVGYSGIKCFYVRGSLNGKNVRRKIERYPKISAEQARSKAKKYIGMLSDNLDPKAIDKAEEVKRTTLKQCLVDYVASRSNLKGSTTVIYEQTLNNHIPDWLNKPLLSITRDMIEQRHKKIGLKSPTSANKTMRIIRALFEYAHGKYENEDGTPMILHNPVKRLSHTKSWYKETRRSTYLKSIDIKPWYQTVNSMPEWLKTSSSQMISDYLLLTLFTGLRRNEAAGLRWDWIDLPHRTLTIPETKNGHPHILPLSDFLIQLLKKRYSPNAEYVFPGPGKTGHIVEPKKTIKRVRNRLKSLALQPPISCIENADFKLHDLRRTFITVAESLGIRDYTLKRLLNHRSRGDVTDGYIITDVERLRAPMQEITDQILLLATQPDNVISFHEYSKSSSNY